MKVNQGFVPSPGGRRSTTDSADRFNDVDCGRCGKTVPDGTAHIVLHYHHIMCHQLFCPSCCPCRRKPKTVMPLGASERRAS